MRHPPKRRRYLRLFLITLAVVAGLAVGIQLLFIGYVNSRLRTELEDEVKELSGGEYELTIQSLRINIFTQSVFFKGVNLHPVADVKPDEPKYAGSFKEFSFEDFHLFAYLFGRNLVVNNIKYAELSIQVFRSPGNGKKGKNAKRFSPYDIVKKHVNSLRIKKIDITNADIRVYEKIKETQPSISSVDNELHIANLRINDSTNEAGKWFVADKLGLLINRFAYQRKGDLFSFKAQRLFATDKDLQLNNALIAPLYKAVKVKADNDIPDSLRVHIAEVLFQGLNPRLFIEHNAFYARRLQIKQPDILIFHYQIDNRNHKRKNTLQDVLHKLPFTIKVESIVLDKGLITYKELEKDKTIPGRITFNDLHAEISGCSNDKMSSSAKRPLIMKVSTMVMHKAKLDVTYTFPLQQNGEFDAMGHLKAVQLRVFNPIIEPLAHFTMKSGQVDSMWFSFHGGQTESKGKMMIAYHDMKIELLNKKTGEKDATHKVLSTLAHALILKEENPSKGKLRIAEINYPADSSRTLFFYSWRSLLSGLRETLGLPKKSK